MRRTRVACAIVRVTGVALKAAESGAGQGWEGGPVRRAWAVRLPRLPIECIHSINKAHKAHLALVVGARVALADVLVAHVALADVLRQRKRVRG